MLTAKLLLKHDGNIDSNWQVLMTKVVRLLWQKKGLYTLSGQGLVANYMFLS